MKTGMGWPVGIVAILGITVIGNVAVMRVASNDPSFSVEPDYYAKAVAFDSTMAQQRRNLELGWRAETAMDPIVNGHPTHLTIRLTDRDAEPLTGASVSVMARFNARANDTLTAVLGENTPGTYDALLPIVTPGEWEVRVDASRPSSSTFDRFTVSTRVQAVRVAGNHKNLMAPGSGTIP